MNKTIFFNLLVIVVSILGCSEQKNKQEVQEILGTEEVDNNSKLDHIDISSVYEREYSDIVGKLFTTELKKNETLRLLFERINSIDKSILDSTLTTNKYIDLNKKYFRFANVNIKMIKDSTLRRNVYDIFEKVMLEHRNKIIIHNTYLDEIEEHRILLHDKKILLKLFITLPLIKKYQSEKRPDTEQLKNMKQDMEVLIEEAEKLIRFE